MQDGIKLFLYNLSPSGLEISHSSWEFFTGILSSLTAPPHDGARAEQNPPFSSLRSSISSNQSQPQGTPSTFMLP